VSGPLANARAFIASIPPRERNIVLAAMAISLALVVVYVVANRPNSLAGDQREYNDMAFLFTQGKPWWGLAPTGIEHASAYRPPAYPLWAGFWYEILGANATRLLLVQSLLAPLTVLLSWLLARRLFGPRAAIATAVVVAVFPLVWEWFGLLYTEALAIPLMVLTFLVFLERPPSPRLAVGVGALMGVAMLIRPTSVFVFAGILAAFVIAAGWRRGGALTAASIGVAALVILPWTIRNYVVTDEFVPLSAQDAALHGTFNDFSANHPTAPYAWQFSTPEVRELFAENPDISDAEYRSELIDLGTDYIAEHPFSVAEAFYWNGFTRFWDVRRPGNALDEVPFEGRSKAVTTVGLVMYYVLLPLALCGIWRHRRRMTLVIPLAAAALAATIVFTVAAGTRYRAPLEPMIAMMAVAAFIPPRVETPARAS
jgi:4-amino-4-deoxy-L-arabinose transferase-like glycosyltransferase